MAQVTVNAKSGSKAVTSATDAWATVRAAAAGADAYANSWFIMSNTGYTIVRGFLNFDISSIPAGSTITGVTLVHPVIGNLTNTDGCSTVFAASTNSDPIVAADYDLITLNSPTEYSRTAWTGISAVTSTNITLAAAAVTDVQTALDTSALVKIVGRCSRDVDNSAPTDVNNYSVSVTTNFQLIIDYTPAATSGFLAIL
jgi:hypothetical protein